MKKYLLLLCLLLAAAYSYAQERVDLITKSNKPVNYSAAKIDTVLRPAMAVLKAKGVKDTVLKLFSIFQPVMFNGSAFLKTVHLDSARFLKGASFDSTAFENDAYFVNDTFGGDADFSHVMFKGRFASFSKAVFQSNASFSCDTFVQFGRFDGTVFLKNANFQKDTFLKAPNFMRATFYSDVNFNDSRFSKLVDFTSSDFCKNAVFTGAVFNKEVFFEGVSFRKIAVFRFATFNFVTYFDNLSLGDSSDILFEYAILPNLLDFSRNNRIKNQIDLTTANFDNTDRYNDIARQYHYINLVGTDLSHVRIDYTHFRLCFYMDDPLRSDTLFHIIPGNSKVTINHDSKIVKIYDKQYRSDAPGYIDSLYDNVYFREYLYQIFPYCRYYSGDGFFATLRTEIGGHFWKEHVLGRIPPLRDSVIIDFINEYTSKPHFPKRLSDDDVMALYEKEIKAFSENGQEISEEKLDIEYKDFKNGGFILPHIWNCYGYHKEWVFYWALLLLAFFTAITFCFLPFLRKNVYASSLFGHDDVMLTTSKNASAAKPAGKSKYISQFLDILLSRIWYSFIYTATIFFPFSMKLGDLTFDRKFLKVLGVAYIIIIYLCGLACIAYMANFVLQR